MKLRSIPSQVLDYFHASQRIFPSFESARELFESTLVSNSRVERRARGLVIIGLLFLLGACAVGIKYLHKYQLRRQSAVFVRRSMDAESRGDKQGAIELMARFLTVEPLSREGVARLALLMDETAKTPKEKITALQQLSRACIRNPDRMDIRRRIVALAMQPGFDNIVDPEPQIEELLLTYPDDAKLMDVKGQLLMRRGKFSEADEMFVRSINSSNQLLEAYEHRAFLCHAFLNQDRIAEQVIAAMLEASPTTAAYLKASGYWGYVRNFEESRKAILKAYELSPEDADAAIAFSDVAWSDGRSEQARSALKRVLDRDAKSVPVIRKLAMLEALLGKRAEARAVLDRGLSVVPDSMELKWQLLDWKLEGGELEGVETGIRELFVNGYPYPELRYLHSRISFAQGNWLQASKDLSEVLPLMAQYPNLGFRVNMFLGIAYEKMNNLDRAYLAFNRAQTMDPTHVPVRQAVAGVLSALGRYPEAILMYQSLAEQFPEFKLQVAQNRTLLNLSRPPERRDWDSVEKLLAEIEAETPDIPELVPLKAELLFSKQNVNEGRELLAKARDSRPDDLRSWIVLSLVSLRDGNFSEGLKILDDAEKKLGDSPDIRLARAQLLTANGLPEDRTPFKKVLEGMEKFPASAQLALLRNVGQIYLRWEDPVNAEEIFNRLSKMDPNDLNVQMLRFDLVRMNSMSANRKASKEDAQREVIARLEEIDGADGPSTAMAQAILLLNKYAESQNPADLEAAQERLRVVERKRPEWSRVSMAEGRINEMRGRPAAAILCYQKAIKQGEPGIEVSKHLAELLYEQKRYAEANQVLKTVSIETGEFETLRMAAECAINSKDTVRALVYADRAVPENSKNAGDWMWRGWVNLNAGRTQAAEAAFRKAVDLGGKNADPWVALVEYLAVNKQADQGLKIIEDMEKRLDAKSIPLALSRCYEVCGRRDKAREYANLALKEKPDDPVVLRAVANLNLRLGDVPNAEVHLTKLMGQQDKELAAWARRELAVALAMTGLYKDVPKALAVLNLSTSERSVDDLTKLAAEDLRARGIVYSYQPERQLRLLGIRMFEEMSNRGDLDANNRFIQAQMYERVGDWVKCLQTFQMLLTSPDEPNPMHIVVYLDLLFKRKEYREAKRWIDRLEKLRPSDAATVMLRAKLLAAEGDKPKATSTIVELAEKNPEISPLAGATLEEIGSLEEADKVLRKDAETSGRANSKLALAGFLARRGRIAEVIELCRSTVPSVGAETAARVLASAIEESTDRKDADLRKAEELLADLVGKDTLSADLHVYLGIIQGLLQKYDEAMASYQKALAIDPKNPDALNYQSFLLALHGRKPDDALKLIEPLKQWIGMVPAILETEGIIRIQKGDARGAINVLDAALGQTSTPSLFFHLAQARLLLGDRPGALAAWIEAKNLGVSSNNLHPLEVTSFAKLRSELEK